MAAPLSLVRDKQFHSITLYNECNYEFHLGLKIIQVSNIGRTEQINQTFFTDSKSTK